MDDDSASDRFIFLGTATSEGVPRVSCLTQPPAPRCETCVDAGASAASPNRRRNTSILIQHRYRPGEVQRSGRPYENVVVDVGKSFYTSALDIFPRVGLRYIDAVVLTHEHADATNGLDDLRDWTMNIGMAMGDGPSSIPVWGDARTLERVRTAFPYLVEPKYATGSGLVPKLTFHQLQPWQWLCPTGATDSVLNGSAPSGRATDGSPPGPCGLWLRPIPVEHGNDQPCLAFRFGNVVYMSDVSRVPPAAMDAIRGCEILVVDALKPGNRRHVSHLCEEEALELATELRPRLVLFTGMTHQWHHQRDNARLCKWSETYHRLHPDLPPMQVELAFDGLQVPFSL